MDNSLLDRLKVKLSNFRIKYGEIPKIIILNPLALKGANSVDILVNALFPINRPALMFSHRIEFNEFEIY